MISDKEKNKLLEEIEKNGNVYLSCMKLGINRSTFYRWLKNKNFKKKADEATEHGRQGNCDIAESALMMKVKQKDLGAIKYYLGHNSPKYKQKVTNHKFFYEKIPPQVPTQKTLEDMIDDSNQDT